MKKFYVFGMAALLCASLFVLGCGDSGGGGGSGSDTKVNAGLELTGKVTAPVKGAKPDTTAIDTAQYTGAVAWQKDDGTAESETFAVSTVYKAVITLTAKSGFTFTGFAGTFTYSGDTSVTPSYAAGVVTITFPATAAADQSTKVNNGLDLTDKVKAPVKDTAPVTTAIDTAQFMGTVAWQTEAGAAVSGNFAASTVYKAVITLTAKDDFTFDGFTGTFIYPGATVSAYADEKVTITFPATAEEGTKEPGPEDDPVQALIAKWYIKLYDANDAATTTAAQYEFTSDGKVLISGTPTYTYTVSDGTITLKFNGSDAGTATYTITGTMLTIKDSVGSILAAGAYYKKAQETDAGALSELVGSWEEEKGGAIQFVINADGSGKWIAYDCTWSVSGNRLTRTLLDLKYSSSIEYTVKDNTLTFTSGTAQGESEYSLADYVGKPLTKVPVSWKAVTDTTFTSSEHIKGIAYGGGKFVAVGGSGKAAYSEDGGVSWKAVTVAGLDSINGIAYGDPAGKEKFVAVGAYGGKAAYSEDGGETWKAVTDTTFTSSEYINAIAYGGGKFVAVGNKKAAYSEDGGETWKAVTDTTFNIDINGIAYGGGKFVAVGNSGKAAYSENGGVSWTEVTADTYGPHILGIAYGGGKFVAVGSNSSAAYSADGETWTKVDDTEINGRVFIYGIAYGGGKFVAVGEKAGAAYSANGVSWTAITDTGFSATAINGIAYGGKKFVAVGSDGKIFYSNDQEE